MSGGARTRLERVGAVHVLTLADPDKRNAIGPELAGELVARAAELEGDPEARVLVVAADGPAFCAGADLPAVFGERRPTASMREFLASYYECFLRIRRLPFPAIAAVDGPAVGAGLNLALSCDLRLASPRARLGATFTRIGLHPGGGCTYFLVQAMGPQRALRVLLEGATLDAEQALAAGLVGEVVEDPRGAALELGERIAGLEPWLARSVVRAVALAATAGLEPTLEFETWAQAESAGSDRLREAVERFRR